MLTNYANSLIDDYNDETKFFYASPAHALRADGMLLNTSEITEANDLLKSHYKKGEKKIVVGAVPFCQSNNSKFIVPKNVFRSGPAILTQNLGLPLCSETRQLCTKYHPDAAKFTSIVENALELIEKTPLCKVVLSSMIEISTNSEIDIKALLLNLLLTNRLSRIFSFVNSADKDHPTLVGASPEVLISKQGANIISNPLAGSIPRSLDPVEDYNRGLALLNSEKDLYEHRFVVSAILGELKPFCSIINAPNKPSLISTPRMWHLSTKITGTLTDSKINVLQLARALHPTPAVCGYPKELARKAIEDLENYNRGLYTGMIGWADAEGNGEWAVTIRCAEIYKDFVRLYAGAGIVEGSKPEKELSEIISKYGTLCDAIGIKLE